MEYFASPYFVIRDNKTQILRLYKFRIFDLKLLTLKTVSEAKNLNCNEKNCCNWRYR